MVGHLLLRGMLVGIIAGLLAFGFAKVFGEPQVDRAIAFEEQHGHDDHADHHHHDQAGAQPGAQPSTHDHHHHANTAGGEPTETDLVSRATQSGLGLLTGVVVFGAAMGGLFSLVFAVVNGRVGNIGPRATAALLAFAAFVAIVLVPALKYPPNPPAVGSADTIGTRTAYFFMMLVLSIVTLAASVGLARRLRQHLGAWNAALVGGAAFILVIALVQMALPEINEVPREFSAVVLWRFRVASLGMQLVLWATIGLLFGALTERAIVGWAKSPAPPVRVGKGASAILPTPRAHDVMGRCPPYGVGVPFSVSAIIQARYSTSTLSSGITRIAGVAKGCISFTAARTASASEARVLMIITASSPRSIAPSQR